jgi:hypothetical protein
MKNFIFPLAALLGGCAMFTSEDTFLQDLGRASCDNMLVCNKAYFLSEWKDLDDCYGDAEDDADDYQDLVDDADCDYDEDKAVDCLVATSKAQSCDEDDLEDAADDCSEVYDCG